MYVVYSDYKSTYSRLILNLDWRRRIGLVCRFKL